MTDVLIVGAGVAALAAAEALNDAGAHVALIDKASRPGGRCATRRVSADPAAAWFDYGAQYFTARDPRFQAVVEADLAEQRLAEWRPTIASAEKMGPTWLMTPSPDNQPRLIGPRGLNHWIRDRFAARSIDVACHQRAVSMTRHASHWQIDTENGQTWQAPRVLITLPAVQAAALLGAPARDITPLADASQALAACHSVVVKAPPLADAQALFMRGGALAWAADNTHKAGVSGASQHLWTLHATPEFSEARVETPTAELADTLIAEFAAASGQAASAMTCVHSHRWRYARPGAGAPDEDTVSWGDPDRGLALAGDWLAGGRIEGAWLSGVDAARRLLNH